MDTDTTVAVPQAETMLEASAPAAKSSRAEGPEASAASHQGRKAASAEAPTQNPDSGRCSFWLPLKRRFCKAHVHKGSRFCGAHLNSDAAFVAAPGERRVPCPLNPNHSVAEKQLKRHLEVCADRGNVATDLPYHRANINGVPSDTTRTNQSGADASGEVGAQAEVLRMDRRSASAQSHRSLDPTQLAALTAMIDELHSSFVEGRMASLVRDTTAAAAAEGALGVDRRAPVADEDSAAGGEGQLEQRRNGPTPFAVRHSAQLDALVDAMAAVGVAPAAGAATSDSRPQLRPGTASEVPMPLPAPLQSSDWPVLAGAPDGDDRSSCAFVELAAGKGAFALVLSDRWAAYQRRRVAEGLPPGTAKRVVVVDRGGFRRKADGRVSKLPPFAAASGGGGGVEDDPTEAAALQRAFLRLRIDLRDLALNCVPELQFHRRPAVVGEESAAQTVNTTCAVPATVFGKHLCGACTDFALSCAVNAEAGDPQMGVRCICIATCCHHLAELRHLSAVHLGWGEADAHNSTPVAKASRATHDALLARLGEHGFDLVASIASWAVSEGGHAPPPPTEDGAVALAVPSTRTLTGRKAKQLVDWLRVLYLRGRGFHAELVDGFVGADVSPENAVILAWRVAA